MTINITKQPKKMKKDISLYSTDIAPKSPLAPQPIQPDETERSAPKPSAGADGLDLYKQDLINPQDPNTVFMDEIHKAVSEKNYKSLLQSDIAAYNLKMNAQKYLDNSLAAQGLGTQGYGTTAHLGVENQAQNLYAQNLENYHQNESDALLEAQQRKEQEDKQAKAEAEAKDTEMDNQLFNYLQETDGSDEQIAEQMDNYGYVQANDGRWYKKNEQGAPDFSSPASNYIQGIISYMRRQTSKQTGSYGTESTNSEVANAQDFLKNYATSKDENGNPTGYGSVEELRKARVNVGDDSRQDSMSYAVGHELDYLEKQLKGGYVKDGTLFKLQAGADKMEAYLVLYLGGKLYIVSSSDDETEGGEVDTKYKQYTGTKTEIIGK